MICFVLIVTNIVFRLVFVVIIEFVFLELPCQIIGVNFNLNLKYTDV